jgi:6-phosphogluconolactonase
VSDVDIRVVDDPAREAGALLAEAARAGGRLALSGGTTPGAAYEAAAVADWSRAEIWFGDDRAVPPGDERSNYRLAQETLLHRLEAIPREVQRINGELGAEEAAREYDELLRGVSLELVLLGIGPDGHTASLFPGTSALAEEDRLAVAVDVAQMGTRRLTLTYPALCGARDVCFLVTGREKAAALATVVEAGHLPAARIVRRTGGPVTVFCDQDAASALPRRAQP